MSGRGLNHLLSALINAAGRGATARQNRSAPRSSAALRLPLGNEPITEFAGRVGALLRNPRTRVYIDTSMLMWLTTIGATSRKQFLDWLAATCGERVHVPAWAAHEYFRHHTNNTIADELKAKTDAMSTLAGETFAYLRPFFDDPLEAAHSAETQRATAREALGALQRLATEAARWRRHYLGHATEVIEFINAHVPGASPVFDDMLNIEALSESRFTGRLPPGFADRRKTTAETASPDGEAKLVGSNRWGDLVFWREVLQHALAWRPQAVVILTNDRKNDWHTPGAASGEPEGRARDLRRSWKPVPQAHPMLVFEARLTAQVEEVILLDSLYLGALLDVEQGPAAKDFVDVAIVPDPPPLPTEKERRATLRDAQARIADAERRLEAARWRFADAPGLSAAKPILFRGILNSREGQARERHIKALLKAADETIGGGGNINIVLDADHLQTLTAEDLVTFARIVADQALADVAGYQIAVVDLAGALPELPPDTAACLYMGLLASMYLERTRDETRSPPQSLAAKQIFALQGETFAALAIDALRAKFDRRPNLPLYLPAANRSAITAILGIDQEEPGAMRLASLRLNGEEVLGSIQIEPRLNLKTLTGAKTLEGRVVVERACGVFGVPFLQVAETVDFSRTYHVPPLLGFKDPERVYVENREADDGR